MSVKGQQAGGGGRTIHVLIPSHVESDRRLFSFHCCVESVSHQTFSQYKVFVSLSGTDHFRKASMDFLKSLHPHQWNVQDTGLQRLPQMEHLRRLVKESSARDPHAYLMFLDNDDMFHPLRLEAFDSAYSALNILDMPLSIPCKLLLSEHLGAKEGRLECFIRNAHDFDKWKRDPKLRKKVQWAPSSQCEQMDCTEYFDFMVPTAVMTKFFRENPIGITSHRFCDLRLHALLSSMFSFEVEDTPVYPWLLLHYKITEDMKKRTFDKHGRANHTSHSIDQVSFSGINPTARDVVLANKFRTLSPGQVSMCRGHLESIVISYIGWDHRSLADARREKVKELNSYYGRGFGNEMWAQAQADISKLLGDTILTIIWRWLTTPSMFRNGILLVIILGGVWVTISSLQLFAVAGVSKEL